MSNENKRISSIVVYFNNGQYKEFNEVSGVGMDKKLGLARFSIQDYKGDTETIHLDQVQSYKIYMENAQ